MKTIHYLLTASLLLTSAYLFWTLDREKESPVNLWAPGPDQVKIEVASWDQNETLLTASGENLKDTYLLCMGWYETRPEQNMVGKRDMEVLRLVSSQAKNLRRDLIRPDTFSVLPIHVQKVEETGEEGQSEVHLIVNGIKLLSASGTLPQEDFPLITGFSGRGTEILRLNDPPPNEASLARVADCTHYFEDTRYRMEVLLCNAEWLKKFIENGELRYITGSGNRNKRAVSPIRQLFPDLKKE